MERSLENRPLRPRTSDVPPSEDKIRTSIEQEILHVRQEGDELIKPLVRGSLVQAMERGPLGEALKRQGIRFEIGEDGLVQIHLPKKYREPKAVSLPHDIDEHGTDLHHHRTLRAL